MVTRKDFLKKSFSLATGLAAAAVDGIAPALSPGFLYPPGAANAFHELCSSCGDCAAACPEKAIALVPHKLSDKKLPALIPAGSPCAMCEDVPCISACRDGALSPPENGGFPPIGVAEIDAQVCLAWNGSVCWTCYDACPLKGSALTLKSGRPTVEPTACSGCGQCEFACPAQNRGIVVRPV